MRWFLRINEWESEAKQGRSIGRSSERRGGKAFEQRLMGRPINRRRAEPWRGGRRPHHITKHTVRISNGKPNKLFLPPPPVLNTFQSYHKKSFKCNELRNFDSKETFCQQKKKQCQRQKKKSDKAVNDEKNERMEMTCDRRDKKGTANGRNGRKKEKKTEEEKEFFEKITKGGGMD